MKSTIFTISIAIFGLAFGWLAIYVGISWWQNFIPQVEALNFLFLLVFAAIGLLCVCVGLAMLWGVIKRTLITSESEEPSEEILPPFEI
ncbi:MAG: hypothetical protein JW869_02275 [Candidatus Omnitrophica bacterium]|nr:hypothetical protein [Candidatus Omnitrophota bacterium]